MAASNDQAHDLHMVWKLNTINFIQFIGQKTNENKV
jgi:hypothetical protein